MNTLASELMGKLGILFFFLFYIMELQIGFQQASDEIEDGG